MGKDTSYSSIGKIHQDNASVLNIFAPDAKAITFIKKLLKHKSHIKPHILIVEDLYTSLSPTGRSSRKKLNRKIM